MEISTSYLGMKLRTPLVASASPLSRNIDDVKRLAQPRSKTGSPKSSATLLPAESSNPLPTCNRVTSAIETSQHTGELAAA
jgi:hypothetical protein